jgi:hypothetical protein
MTGDYPRFNASYTHEELVEHLQLSPADMPSWPLVVAM